jgi:VWFA-related protein
LRTEVRVVEVPVVVRDASFHAVAGLKRDDFEIYEDGRKQTITAFSVQHSSPGPAAVESAGGGAQKDQPRTRFLALCFDDLHLLPHLLNSVKEAARRFVQTSLAPGDQVVVVKTSKSEDAKFTSGARALVEQIDKVTAYTAAPNNEAQRCPHIEPHEAFQIANRLDPGDRLLQAKMAECVPCYNRPCPETDVTAKAEALWARVRANTANSLSVIDSVVDGMAKLPGQRIVLLTSGGFLTGTLEADMDRLMQKARRAEVVINSLDARGLYLNASAGIAYDGMAVLSSGTGGTFFHNNNDMELGFKELGGAPDTSYMLGFAPSAADGKFHDLKARVAFVGQASRPVQALAESKGYSVEARLGYTAAPAEAAAADLTLSRLDREVMESDAVTHLPASFTWEHWPGQPGITLVAHLDIAHLRFVKAKDRHVERFTIVAALLDASGNFVAGKRSELELEFKDKTFEQFAKTGFTAALTIQAPSGSYSVRAVAQDSVEGKLAASSATIQIK